MINLVLKQAKLFPSIGTFFSENSNLTPAENVKINVPRQNDKIKNQPKELHFLRPKTPKLPLFSQIRKRTRVT